MSTQEAPTALTELLGPLHPDDQPQPDPKPRRRGRARPAAAAPAAASPKATTAPLLLIGAEPRVDLLPPEIKARRQTQQLQRKLLWAVLGVLVLVVLGVGGAWYASVSAQMQLAAEQQRTSSLAAEQLQFSKISTLESQTQLVQTAQRVAGATEIDWQGYLTKVQATLPAGVTIKTVKVDSETPLVAYAQPNTPLLGPRVATITFTATSDQLPDVPAWLDALSKLKGFADANPDTVNLTAQQYSATITMHVNADVFDNRFAPKDH
ncbi:hypothetical protein GCM10022286_16300 [Gryllotalpicola daejeonensis]|uniref:Fimbrial assembly protein n=1 Tax=Gryllotalpicola daejeonensis TaxID=993087 RepID=A0ABP7ZJL3_9MICO